MPSFNQHALQYKVQNANSVIVMIGDVPLAFGQTSAESIDFGTEPLFGIGSAKIQEIQQLRFTPTVSVDALVLTAQGLGILGYPTVISGILANNSFDIHVMDQSGKILFTFVAAVANNYNINIPTNAVLTETYTFTAQDVLDSTGVSILNSNSALQNVGQLAAIASGANTLGL